MLQQNKKEREKGEEVTKNAMLSQINDIKQWKNRILYIIFIPSRLSFPCITYITYVDMRVHNYTGEITCIPINERFIRQNGVLSCFRTPLIVIRKSKKWLSPYRNFRFLSNSTYPTRIRAEFYTSGVGLLNMIISKVWEYFLEKYLYGVPIILQ